MKKFILILLLFSSRQVNSQTWVLIPDANFAAALQTIVPTAMNGNSLNITSTLVTTSTQTISVPSMSISDISGVQYFSALVSLNCSLNSLTTLPSLPNSLQVLACGQNSLTTLPALSNSLQSLSCFTNSLTSLPVLPNTLVGLGCFQNPLNSLPALPNSLQYLSCVQNSLTTLPALPNSLKFLDCSHNNIINLPTLPNVLTELYCNNNNIKCFPVFPASILPWGYDMTHLQYIYHIDLDGNPFNCLPNYLPNAMPSYYLSTPLCAAGNSNGCPIASGIKENSKNVFSISIFPNPSNGQFNIETNIDGKFVLQLTDVVGKLILEQETENKTVVEFNNLNNGVYNLVISSNGFSMSKKLIIIN